MSVQLISPATGVQCLFVENKSFHTTLVSFQFYLPLSRRTVAENALLPFVLTTCGKQYPDFSALNMELSRLYGASLDASAEKMGDLQLLKMRVSVVNDRFAPKGESVVRQAVEMLLSLIFEPKAENGAFDENDLAREKRKAIEHIKSEMSEKRLYAKTRMIEEMYRDSVYGLPKCGTPEQIGQITGESLYGAWQRMLETACVRVHVIGETVPDGLFETIAERFSRARREAVTDLFVTEATPDAKEVRTVTERMDIKQGKLVMGFSSEMSGDDDATFPLLIATDIFGGGPYSKLFSNVREKMSLCYYCSASSVRVKGLVTVDSGVEPQNAERAQKEILAQLSALQNGEVSDFELESSLKSLRDSMLAYHDSQNALDLWYGIKALQKTVYTPEEVAKKIGGITRDDVIKAVRGIRLHTVYRLLPKE